YNLEIISVYEYIEKRFGKKMRLLLVFTYIIKMLVVVGSIVYVPSLILSKITGLSINMTIALIVVVSIFYTVLGGIQTVIWTDVFQMLALWIGIVISIITVFKVTPYSLSEIFQISKESGKLMSLDFNTNLKAANTFWAGLFGGGILHIAYFGVDQTQVQRVLTAKSLDNTKYSLWFSGVFSVVQMFLFLVIGVVLFVFYKGETFNNANEVYIKFALEEIPKGYLGIIIAAVFAATMSSIDSSLNSMTTVFMKDIYEVHFQKKIKTVSEMNITRIMTGIFGIIIAYFAFNVSASNSSVLEIISKYGSYLLGAMLGVFSLGMFTTKADERGVLIGFIFGILGTAFIS
ncbi:sodium:solute symporter family transporter, partial [Cetobacterium sp.]